MAARKKKKSSTKITHRKTSRKRAMPSLKERKERIKKLKKAGAKSTGKTDRKYQQDKLKKEGY